MTPSPFVGVALLSARYQNGPTGRLNPLARILRGFNISNPILQTEQGLQVALFHKTAFSTETGEPIAYYDLRHNVDGVGRVSDRFIFTIRGGEMTMVCHLSRKVLN